MVMDRVYRPHEFAKMIGRTVQTLQRWDTEGILKAHRTPTDRRFYTHDQYLEFIGQKASASRIAVYTRVSGSGQKADLASQRAALEQYCAVHGKAVAHWLSDVGSGLNYERKHFTQLMEMVERGEVAEIVIAHQDRLVRFGYEWFEAFCARHGCVITVMNLETLSPEQEVTQDLLSIIHCFSARLSGLRRYKKQIAEMVREPDSAETENSSQSRCSNPGPGDVK